MISYNARDKIRKQFLNFNNNLNTVAYPDNKEVKQDAALDLNLVNVFDNNLPQEIPSFEIIKEKQPELVVHYAGKKKLSTNSRDILNINEEVDICVYSMSNIRSKPFLLFSLFKNDDTLTFLSINANNKQIEDITKIIQKKLKLKDNSITYEGKFVNNKRTQLWFQCDNITDDVTLGKYNDDYFWAISSEIINDKKLLTFAISETVIEFFLENNDFLYIKNKFGSIYESPMIGYYGNHANYINFAANIGVMRADMDSIYGPHYYYGNYEKAIEYSIKDKNKNKAVSVPKSISGVELVINDDGQFSKGGLLRSAIFTSNIAMIPFIEKSSNFNENWTTNNNSIIKNNGSTNNPHVLIVLDNFEQQYPLQYFYVDTSQEIKTNETIFVE